MENTVYFYSAMNIAGSSKAGVGRPFLEGRGVTILGLWKGVGAAHAVCHNCSVVQAIVEQVHPPVKSGWMGMAVFQYNYLQQRTGGQGGIGPAGHRLPGAVVRGQRWNETCRLPTWVTVRCKSRCVIVPRGPSPPEIRVKPKGVIRPPLILLVVMWG